MASMFALAVRHDAIAANPVRETLAVAPTGGEAKAISVVDVKALRVDLRADQVARDADLIDLVDLLLVTGVRIGEALALRWQDIDFETRRVVVSGTMVRDGARGLVRQGQTKGKRARSLSIPQATVTMLLERQVHGVPSEVVFPSAALGFREVSTVNKQWRAFRSRNPRWSEVQLKHFRKTVATTLERTVGLESAASVLGHAGVAVTSKHYVERALEAPDHSEILAGLLA